MRRNPDRGGWAAVCWIGFALVGCGEGVLGGPVTDAAVDDPDSGPEQSALCDTTSGTRLAVRSYRFESAGDEVIGLFDKDLTVECQFAVMADGMWRCTPTASHVGGAVLFLDDGCTDPVVGFNGPAMALASITRTTDCTTEVVFFRVGDTIAPAGIPETVYQGEPGNCAATASSAYATYHAGVIMGPSDFVEGVERQADDTSRLNQLIIDGSDGSVLCEATTLLDTALSTRCSLQTSSDEVVRCLPQSGPMLTDYFTDNTGGVCQNAETVGVSGECADPSPPYAVAVDSSGCWDVPAFTEVLGEFQDPLYTEIADVCSLVADTAQQFFQLGDDVEHAAFAAVQVEMVETTARLARSHWVGSDGFRMHRAGWRDNKLDFDCAIAMAADDAMRCLPPAVGLATYYSDAGCTTPVLLAAMPACAPAPLHVSFGLERSRWRISAAGEAVAGPVYQGGVDNCTEVDLDVTSLYPADYEISATTFAEVGLAVE